MSVYYVLPFDQSVVFNVAAAPGGRGLVTTTTQLPDAGQGNYMRRLQEQQMLDAQAAKMALLTGNRGYNLDRGAR